MNLPVHDDLHETRRLHRLNALEAAGVARRATLRSALGALMGAPLLLANPAPSVAATAAGAAGKGLRPCEPDWPDWAAFKQQFVASDGRVVDPETPRAHTVSEAQAYALFFALVANDPAAFALVLKWTENNLAGGDLSARLPAWQWGKRDDGQWGVVDQNSATDADLWLIYSLAEAGRLWGIKRLEALAQTLASRLLRASARVLPVLGTTLLPGPQGFQPEADQWRLNPSYYPLQQLRWFAKTMKHPAWGQILSSSRAIVFGTLPKGFAPDWVLFHPKRGFEGDPVGGPPWQGSYDAIRVYLWAGLMDPADANTRPLLDKLAPMAQFIAREGHPPERIQAFSGEASGPGPSGFSAAMLPMLTARGDKAARDTQSNRLVAKPIRAKAYYEQALNLFAMGKLNGYYRFAVDGRLVPKWKGPCRAEL